MSKFMMADCIPEWESPFKHAKEAYPGNSMESGAELVIRDGGFLSIINIRGCSSDTAFVAAIESALPLTLPVTANEYTYDSNSGQSLSWLSPNEWLLVGNIDDHAATLAALNGALAEVDSAVTDVSHGYGCIFLSGNSARKCLAQGSPLDFSVQQFGQGKCAQTTLAKASVFVWSEGDDQLGILVRRSYADYLWQWLVTTAKTDGVFNAS